MDGPTSDGKVTTDPDCPLKPEHCALLTQVMQSCAKTRGILEKCKRCNLPVEELEQANESQYQQAASLKREFFPHMP